MAPSAHMKFPRAVDLVYELKYRPGRLSLKYTGYGCSLNGQILGGVGYMFRWAELRTLHRDTSLFLQNVVFFY